MNALASQQAGIDVHAQNGTLTQAAGATIAAGRAAVEVWTLRIVAAIVVAILLTAFVLLLTYLA